MKRTNILIHSKNPHNPTMHPGKKVSSLWILLAITEQNKINEIIKHGIGINLPKFYSSIYNVDFKIQYLESLEIE